MCGIELKQQNFTPVIIRERMSRNYRDFGSTSCPQTLSKTKLQFPAHANVSSGKAAEKEGADFVDELNHQLKTKFGRMSRRLSKE